MDSSIQLIVGLGNPGPKYEQTRHNVGFWFVDEVARQQDVSLKIETKFRSEVAKTKINGSEVWLLKPTTYMNESGQAVGALSRFYKINPENILVVHDELDLPPGTVRLKKGGGHGGHNGLRDIISHLSSREFTRIRVGIGHPGNSRDVTNYVLKPPMAEQRIDIERSLDSALAELSNIVKGEAQKAMNALHSQ